jgi:hypothetical protein
MAAAAAKKEPTDIVALISKIRGQAGALAPAEKSGVPFPFRGIDGTVNHLAPFLTEHGIITVPEVLEAEVTQREVGNRVVKTALVKAAYTFMAPDGSSVRAVTSGLADDFADRAIAQAQSVAFRVALLQTFTLPTQSEEPEQSGQKVQDAQAAAPVQNVPTKAEKTVDNAKADPLDALRRMVKVASGAKNMSSADLNAMGTAISKNFFNEKESLEKLMEQIKAIEVK